MEIYGQTEMVLAEKIKPGECFIHDGTLWMKAFEIDLEYANDCGRCVALGSGQIGLIDKEEVVEPVKVRAVIENDREW